VVSEELGGGGDEVGFDLGSLLFPGEPSWAASGSGWLGHRSIIPTVLTY
jgi:hypothetical protein